MTHVSSITVQGLAARADEVSLHFKTGTNILYGLNGSGKTSLLRLMYSALSDDVALIRRVPFHDAVVNFVDDSGEAITRKITADIVASTPLPVPQTVMTINGPITIPIIGQQQGWASSQARGVNFQPSYLNIFRLFGDPIQQFWGGGPESPYSESRLDQQFFQLVANKWSTYSNQLLSRVRTLQDEGIAEVLESLFSRRRQPSNATVDANYAYEQVQHFFVRRGLNLDFSKKSFLEGYVDDPRLRRVVDGIDHTERLIAEAEEPRQELENLVSRFISTNKRVIFSEGGIHVETGDGEIGIDLLSSGEKHLLRILLECLATPSNCLLIDEPELSLHIDWQRELPKALETINPLAQTVMATHSPDIMAEVSDERIIAL